MKIPDQIDEAQLLARIDRAFDFGVGQLAKMLPKWPNNASVLYALALLAKRQGRWSDSRSYFERTMLLDPLSPDVRIDYAAYAFDLDGHCLELYYYMEQVGWDSAVRPASQRIDVAT